MLLSRYSSQLSAVSGNADFILCELSRVYVVLFAFPPRNSRGFARAILRIEKVFVD